ncbi:MAG: FecR domain-containing protein [Acidobacteriota bacterium]|nr:FecR domain-containing protein [Acidobacteriota bacterium]
MSLLRVNAVRLLWGLIWGLVFFAANLTGQGFSDVEARISGVTGSVVLSGNGLQSGPASRGLPLSPGNVIDTRGGGRAVISLTDGSVVVVQPGSVVTLKDFHQAGSLRELFEITLGQVRVRINHFAGKPNPYRMNSPTASIAVRGTEFSITVDRTGDTRVVVFEGSVEVTSLIDPSQRVVVETGQGVALAPGFGFQYFVPNGNDLARADNDRSNGKGPGSGGPPGGDHDQPSARAQAGTYERYIAGLESLDGLPLLLRYNALPEAYLDSAENPAYSTAFHSAEARLYLLPSLQGTPESVENSAGLGDTVSLPANFAASSQFSSYTPLRSGRMVLGASLTGSYFNSFDASGSGEPIDPAALGPIPSMGSLVTSGKSTSRFVDGSLSIASGFGKNSFGLAAEALRGNGALTSTTPDPDQPGQVLRDSRTDSSILQTRLTFGYKRDLSARHTFGAFARYGFLDAQTAGQFNLIRGAAQPLSLTHSPGHTIELGARLRGTISPRLAYGAEVAWFGISLADTLSTSGVTSSQQRDREHRESAGMGLAYQLSRRTMLIGDFAFGLSNLGAVRFQPAAGLLLQNGAAAYHFESVHVAVQHQLGARFFLLASAVNVWQGNNLTYSVFPNADGSTEPFSDSLFSTSPAAYLAARHISDFGGGVRITRDLFAQYLFSTDYGYSPSSHTLMLRYTFHFGRE